jgi:hypothetical protein
MKKFINFPVLIGIIVAFSLIGYLATPDNRYDLLKRKLEWAASFGLIGVSLALYLSCALLLPPKQRSSLRPLAFLGLQIISFLLVIAIYWGIAAIDFGGEIGRLFYGDSGFAFYGVVWGAALALVGGFICYLVLHFIAKSGEIEIGQKN